MTGWRQAIELAMGEKDLAALGAIARSRTEPVSRVERARMLLACREDPSFFAVAQDIGVHHQTVTKGFSPRGTCQTISFSPSLESSATS
jgi:hypothetical protein